jgi:hypothetical protein
MQYIWALNWVFCETVHTVHRLPMSAAVRSEWGIFFTVIINQIISTRSTTSNQYWSDCTRIIPSLGSWDNILSAHEPKHPDACAVIYTCTQPPCPIGGSSTIFILWKHITLLRVVIKSHIKGTQMNVDISNQNYTSLFVEALYLYGLSLFHFKLIEHVYVQNYPQKFLEFV